MWLQIATSRIRAYIHVLVSTFVVLLSATDNKSNSVTIDMNDAVVATYGTMEERREDHDKETKKK